MSEPLVSVITPFRNTAAYLAESIESVLAQSYSHFEYILSDNGSTDGSVEIAEAYARRDPRIRFIRQKQPLSQVQHYNCVLREISGDSQYCKIVQADDSIFPECLLQMVAVFEQSDSIGLVSSQYLKGSALWGSDFPCLNSMLPGKEMVRLYLRNGVFVFGSPTAVMYRSSLVRQPEQFYDESLLHEDTEKCIQILEHWDFGFVHQVLSFLRTDNPSVSAQFRDFHPNTLDRYILVQRYAPAFLEPEEAQVLMEESKRLYYDMLVQEGLRFPGSAFWHYHKGGLKTLDESLDAPYFGLRMARKLFSLAANPRTTTGRALNLWKDRSARRN